MPHYVARPHGTEADLIGVVDVGQLTAGAQIDVASTEAAVFVKDGYARGKLAPGRHELTETSALAAQLLAPGSTTVCFVSTVPMTGIEVGGSLGRLADSAATPQVPVRAYAEMTVQVLDPEAFVATALPSSSQDALGWLNAQLLQALQRTVTQLVASGEVSIGTLKSSTALVDHHLCHGATELEAAGIRVVEVTDVKVPEAEGAGAATATPSPHAEVPAGKTVLGSVPPEALADSSDPRGSDASQAVSPAGWPGPGPPAASADYGAASATPPGAHQGGSGTFGYAASGGGAPGGHAYGPATTPGYSSGSTSSGGCVIGGILMGILAVVIGAVAAFAFFSTQSTASSSGGAKTKPVAAVVWDGRSPFHCSNGSKRIQNVTAKLSRGTAIEASGSCSLLLENVNIESAVGIRATDAAKVTVDGGSVQGTTHSIEVGGGAAVYLKGGATVRGGFDKTGRGKVLRIKQRH